MSGYRTGHEEAQKSVKSGSSGSSNLIYWKEDGEQKVVRLLTDEIITIGWHSFIPGNDGKPHDFACAAQLAEPRYCVICEEIEVPNKFKGGQLEPARAKDTTIGLAVLREEKPNGDVVDVLGEDGKPSIGIIRQGARNFWDVFNGYYSRYRTTIDRDYLVTRHGKNKDTKYAVIPMDFDPERGEIKDGAESEKILRKIYADALADAPSVVDYIEKMGSKERYDFFLSAKKPESVEDHPGGTEEFAEPETESAGGFDALSAKLKSHKKS